MMPCPVYKLLKGEIVCCLRDLLIIMHDYELEEAIMVNPPQSSLYRNVYPKRRHQSLYIHVLAIAITTEGSTSLQIIIAKQHRPVFSSLFK